MTRVLWVVLILAVPRIGSAQMAPMDLCANSSDLVPAGQTVTFSSSLTNVGCLDIRGTAVVSGTLVVDHITVHPGGTLELRAGGIITFRDAPLSTSHDPEQWGRGLLVFGRFIGRGSVKTPYARVTADLTIGQTAISLQTPVTGWVPGDRCLVPDSRHLKWNEAGPNFSGQWETCTVQSVSSDGRTVTIAPPLKFNHPGARNMAGQAEPTMQPHLLNLTRSSVIRSANPGGTRGHVACLDQADCDIQYVRFESLGRTPLEGGQIGRYPLHMHHLRGPSGKPPGTPQFVLTGNVVEDSKKHGVAIHNTHYGLVNWNITYNTWGAAFLIAEDGNESFNVVEDNFAVRSQGTGGREGNERQPIGFAMRGPNNYLRRNHAANLYSREGTANEAYGFRYGFVYLGNIRVPNFPGASTEIAGQYRSADGNAMPILEHRDNEVYGATESGLTYWWIGAFGADFPRQDVPTSTFRNDRIWHVYNKGVFHYEAQNVVHDGLTVRGQDAALSACCAIGFDGADYLALGFVLRNFDIQGMNQSILPSAAGGPQTYENGYLHNLNGFNIRNLWTSSAWVDKVRPREITIRNVRFGSGDTLAALGNSLSGPVVTLDRIEVIDHNGIAGDTFRLYHPTQSPTVIVPQTVRDGGGTLLLGAPVAGLTNAQAWRDHGVAVAGAVASCTTTRGGIKGFVCASGASPSPGDDDVKPTVSIDVPPSPLRETITIRATCLDNVGCASMRLLVNSAQFGVADTTPPYDFPLNTLTMGNGSYTFTVNGRDAAGNESTSTPEIRTVSNPAPSGPVSSPTSPPAPAITLLGCTYRLDATPPDGSGGWRAQFKRDGINVGPVDWFPPFWMVADRLPPGTYTFYVVWTKAGQAVTSASHVQRCAG